MPPQRPHTAASPSPSPTPSPGLPSPGGPPQEGPPLVGQLRGRGYVLDVRRTAAGRTAPPAGRGLACPVVVTRAADREADEVVSLARAGGIPLVRLDAERLEADELALDPVEGTVRLGPLSFRPTVVWWRHYSPAAARGTRTGPVGVLHAESWTAALHGLSDLAHSRLTTGPLSRARQLRDAADLGVPVPRTLMTSRPDLAPAALGCGRVVVKAVHEHFVEADPGRLCAAFPEVHDSERLRRDAAAPGFPVLVQEYLPHDAELRVYWLDGRIHAFTVDKARPDDLWLDTAGVRVREVPAPVRVADAVARLARHWSMAYGAFDFLLREDEAVFLECNTAGDWRWFETRAGTRRITGEVLAMLVRHHERAVRAPSCAGLTGRLPVDAGLFLLR